jgi:hypothetical protein
VNDLHRRIRVAISDAYYEARNNGETMETAADAATSAVLDLIDQHAPPDTALREARALGYREGHTLGYRKGQHDGYRDAERDIAATPTPPDTLDAGRCCVANGCPHGWSVQLANGPRHANPSERPAMCPACVAEAGQEPAP